MIPVANYAVRKPASSFRHDLSPGSYFFDPTHHFISAEQDTDELVVIVNWQPRRRGHASKKVSNIELNKSH